MTKHKSETPETMTVGQKKRLRMNGKYQQCPICGTRWLANEVLPCPRCSQDTVCMGCATDGRDPHICPADNELRLAIEQDAAYYFREIRKFQPLDLDHLSLENWKDFMVWREGEVG